MAKIRGVSPKQYAKYMRAVARGETTDEKLVKQGKLRPSERKGIAKEQDNEIFSNRNKTKGYRAKKGECLVPTCRKVATRRGLCNTHRSYAYAMMKRKNGKGMVATEANLIKRRLLLPKASGGDMRSKTKKRTKKKTVNKSKKKAIKKSGKKKKTKKKLRRVGSSSSSFPQKLINSDVCIYPRCKNKRKGGGRGLCVKHYSQYKRKRKPLSEKGRKRLDRDLIKRRLLLPSKPSRSIKRHSSKTESSAFEIGSTIKGSIKRY